MLMAVQSNLLALQFQWPLNWQGFAAMMGKSRGVSVVWPSIQQEQSGESTSFSNGPLKSALYSIVPLFILPAVCISEKKNNTKTPSNLNNFSKQEARTTHPFMFARAP